MTTITFEQESDDVFETAPPRTLIELFCSLAGRGRSWPMQVGSRSRSASMRRIEEAVARRKAHGLTVANKQQTRGSSAIPRQQEIAQAIGHVRTLDPIGADTLWDISEGEICHPGVPSMIASQLVVEIATGRHLMRLGARDRITAHALAPGAAEGAYRLIVLGTPITPPCSLSQEQQRIHDRMVSAADRILVTAAGEAARAAIKWLR